MAAAALALCRKVSFRRFAWWRFTASTGFFSVALLAALVSFVTINAGAEKADNLLNADQSWQVILEQAGGPGTRFHDQAEAMNAARQHLEKQETSLRDFESRFPSDGRRYSAQIRLSSVLWAESKLKGKSALREEAKRLLADLEYSPATPPPVKADAVFARLSQDMEDMSGRADTSTRDALMDHIRRFDLSFPRDRRTPGLLAEVATLYDSEPEEKRRLLSEAQSQTVDEMLRLRIGDDLKRLDLLGKPLDARLQPCQGGSATDLVSHRGHVVVLLFWASWSAPALRELAGLMQTAHQFAGRPVDFLTVSLDEDRAALAATIKAADLRWIVHCDGRGWKGELVQSLGINTLPTVFVLDRRGNLVALNARDRAQEAIERALAP